jgi:short-subunit dehydrogenase
MAEEVRPLGIRVTIVEPSAFRTEFAGDKNMRPAHVSCPQARSHRLPRRSEHA